jgi:tellurite resistance protein
MVTVWVLSRWLKIAEVGKPANAFWPGITPALLIPVVGNVVVPLAGVKLGYAEWSAAQFGIGLFFWLVVMALLIVRLGQHGIWPQRLLPTTFVTVAPPSVIGLAIIQLGAPTTLSWMAWGVAVFFLLWSASFTKQIASSPFAITFWALSFPLASFCALTLRLSEFAPLWFGEVASGLLVIVSLLIVMLILRTLNGLRKGTLLTPEPGANVAPASSAPV